MNNVRHLSQVATSSLLLVATACDRDNGAALPKAQGTNLVAPAQGHSRNGAPLVEATAIRNFDFTAYLRQLPLFQDCAGIVQDYCANVNLESYSDPNVRAEARTYCATGLNISIAYSDLTGDGLDEAIVQGSSCHAGTGGPDIHSVYSLDAHGPPIELDVQGDPAVPSVLFGNSNYELQTQEGRLVADHFDTSGREHPLIITYKWEGKSFVVDDVRAAPVYKTSYDCSKATKEVERAICYVESLARLDIRLASSFQSRLTRTAPSERNRLVDEEQAWVRDRNNDCPIYKWWVDCLTEAYEKRIRQLTQPQTRTK